MHSTGHVHASIPWTLQIVLNNLFTAALDSEQKLVDTELRAAHAGLPKLAGCQQKSPFTLWSRLVILVLSDSVQWGGKMNHPLQH